MRSLSLTLGLLSVLMLCLSPKTEALPAAVIFGESLSWQVVAHETAYDDVRMLLHTIERANVMETMGTCDDLSPIPLYENSPSVDDWTIYCAAVVSGDQDRCGAIADSIEPDLRSICYRAPNARSE